MIVYSTDCKTIKHMFSQTKPEFTPLYLVQLMQKDILMKNMN